MKDSILFEAGLFYEECCERYDRLVCRYRNVYGIALSSTSEEQQLINIHANAVRILTISRYNLTHTEFHRALKLVHHIYPHGMTDNVLKLIEENRQRKRELQKEENND